MNKYLLMSAAAAMAATAGGSVAQASTIHFTRSGVTYCDYFTVNHTGGIYAAVHHAPNCGSSAINDVGAIGKKMKGGVGHGVQFADVTWQYLGIASDALDFEVGAPLGSGHWNILVNTNGNTGLVLNSGGEKPNKVKPGAKLSTLSKAIAAFKASK